jgi:excisionase family DNA binding protein
MDNKAPNNDSIALRPHEAARLLTISPRKLWQLTHDGEIPCAKVGKLRLYSREALQRWLTNRLKGGEHD